MPATLPPEHLQRIMLAGLESPLAGRQRGWRFLVLRDAGACDELLHAMGAPASPTPQALVVLFALEAPWRRRAERLLAEAGRCRDFAAAAVRSSSLAKWFEEQARLATGAMATLTRSLGWEARVLSQLDSAAMRRTLRLPGPIAFATILAVGGRSVTRPGDRLLSVAAR